MKIVLTDTLQDSLGSGSPDHSLRIVKGEKKHRMDKPYLGNTQIVKKKKRTKQSDETMLIDEGSGSEVNNKLVLSINTFHK